MAACQKEAPLELSFFCVIHQAMSPQPPLCCVTVLVELCKPKSSSLSNVPRSQLLLSRAQKNSFNLENYFFNSNICHSVTGYFTHLECPSSGKGFTPPCLCPCVCVCARARVWVYALFPTFQHLNHWTDFHFMWCVRYAIGGPPTLYFLISYTQ
jgi:hypothetical protein